MWCNVKKKVRFCLIVVIDEKDLVKLKVSSAIAAKTK